MSTQRVRILVNKRSGFLWSFQAVQKAFDRYWDTPGNDLSYQFCRDPEDGRTKARRAAEQGFDVLLVVGGDGTISTAGSALIGSDTALGVIPMGSGNGFARHFAIPLKPEDAAKALAQGRIHSIDVGTVNDRPFLVTCSMAWDAAIVRSFEKSPVRGVLPYVFAGAYEFFEYDPQPITATLDSGEVLRFPDPLVFTVANLTQFGGGAVIAPDAEHDDGKLNLVVARHQDVPVLFANIVKLFNGAIAEIPAVVYRRFQTLTVERGRAAPIQIDGELVDAEESLRVAVKPSALKIVVPAE
jgi:YegS/Rv2252/BmrU family lipid kinase